MEEVRIDQVPIQEDVYRPEMVTPDYGITSQPIFSPGDQWSVPLMQWEMPQQNMEDTSTSAHAMNLEVVGDEDVGDQAAGVEDAGDQAAGDDGRRRRRRRGIVSRILRPFTYSPVRYTPHQSRRKRIKENSVL